MGFTLSCLVDFMCFVVNLANHGSRYMVPTSARGFSLFGTWSSWVRVGYMYTLECWFSIKFDPQAEVLKKITELVLILI